MVQSTKQRENVALLTAAIVGLVALLCWRFAGQATVLVAVLRWTALAALVVYGCFRRTLTAWIFIAMLVALPFMAEALHNNFLRLAAHITSG